MMDEQEMTMKVRFYIDTTDQTPDNAAVLKEIKERFSEKENGSHYSKEAVRVHGIGFYQNEQGTYTESPHFLYGQPTAVTDEAGLTICGVELCEDFPISLGMETPFKMPKGVYKTDNAQGIVEEAKTDGHSRVIRVSIVADELDAVVELFNSIRQGEAKPTHHWIDQPKEDEQNDTVVPSEQPA